MPRFFQNQSIIDRGTAEPPHEKRPHRGGVRLRVFAPDNCWMPSQTVGTPAENVTFSVSKSLTRPAGAQVGTRVGDLGPDGGGDPRIAPGRGVEHRDHRKHVVAGSERKLARFEIVWR